MPDHMFKAMNPFRSFATGRCLFFKRWAASLDGGNLRQDSQQGCIR